MEEIFDSGSRFNRRRKPRGDPSTCSRSNLSFSDLINLTRANIHWECVSGNMVEWNSTVASRVGTWSNLRKQMKEWRDWMWMVDGLWMLVTPGCTGYTRWVLADSNEVTLVTVVTGVIHGLHCLHWLLWRNDEMGAGGCWQRLIRLHSPPFDLLVWSVTSLSNGNSILTMLLRHKMWRFGCPLIVWKDPTHLWKYSSILTQASQYCHSSANIAVHCGADGIIGQWTRRLEQHH